MGGGLGGTPPMGAPPMGAAPMAPMGRLAVVPTEVRILHMPSSFSASNWKIDGAWTTTAWSALLSVWPYSDRSLFTVGTCVILEGTFLLGALIFWMLRRLFWARKWHTAFHTTKDPPQPPQSLLREAWMDHFLSLFVFIFCILSKASQKSLLNPLVSNKGVSLILLKSFFLV